MSFGVILAASVAELLGACRILFLPARRRTRRIRIRLVLNIGSIRIYILMTGVASNETNTYVRMYIEEFILVDLDTLELNIELN